MAILANFRHVVEGSREGALALRCRGVGLSACVLELHRRRFKVASTQGIVNGPAVAFV